MTLPRPTMLLAEPVHASDIDDEGMDHDHALDAFAYLVCGIRQLCTNDIASLAPIILDGVGMHRIDPFLELLADQMPEYPDAQKDYDALVTAIETEMELRHRAVAVIFGEPIITAA